MKIKNKSKVGLTRSTNSNSGEHACPRDSQKEMTTLFAPALLTALLTVATTYSSSENKSYRRRIASMLY